MKTEEYDFDNIAISDVPSSDPGDEEIEVPEPTKDENGKGRVSSWISFS